MKIFTISLEILIIIFSISFIVSLMLAAQKQIQKIRVSKNIGISSSGVNKFNSSWLAVMLRNGVPIFNKPAEMLNSRLTAWAECVEYLKQRLQVRGLVTTSESIGSSIFLFVLLFAVLVMIVFQSVVAGFAVALFVLVCIFVGIKAAIDKESESLRVAVPDALNTMLACFQSGYSISQTFAHLINEGTAQSKKLFEKVSQVFSTGGTVSEALNSIKENKSVPELTFVALALDVQHQTGGSIRPVLESAKEMIESKLELLAHLKVQTAQAKLSARVVTLLPFGLIAVFSIVSPDFLKPFFTSVFGFLVFCVACAMQAAGVILVRKMLKVDI